MKRMGTEPVSRVQVREGLSKRYDVSLTLKGLHLVQPFEEMDFRSV